MQNNDYPMKKSYIAQKLEEIIKALNKKLEDLENQKVQVDLKNLSFKENILEIPIKGNELIVRLQEDITEKLAKYMEKIDLAEKVKAKVNLMHGNDGKIERLYNALTERFRSIDELSQAKKASDIAYQTGKLHKDENTNSINEAIRRAKNAKSCKAQAWATMRKDFDDNGPEL
jgi:hypothetical protein